MVHGLCVCPYDLSWLPEGSLQPARPDPDAGNSKLWHEDVLRLISDGIDAGEFRAADRRLGLIAITGLIQTTIRRYHGQSPGTFTPDQMADQIAAFAARGLAVDPASSVQLFRHCYGRPQHLSRQV